MDKVFGIPVTAPGGPYAGKDIAYAHEHGNFPLPNKVITQIKLNRAYYLILQPDGTILPRLATVQQILLEIQAVGQLTFKEIAVEMGVELNTIFWWKRGKVLHFQENKYTRLIRVMREKQYMNHIFKITIPRELDAIYKKAMAILGFGYVTSDPLKPYEKYKQLCEKRGGSGIELAAAVATVFDVPPALSRRLQVFSYTATMIAVSVRQDLLPREVISKPYKAPAGVALKTKKVKT